MTKPISAALKAHLAEEHTTMATCWRIQRTDGQEYFFTDHDTDITFGGDVYEAASGMIPMALTQSRGLAVDNMEVVAFLDNDKIAEADLSAGLFDFAEVDVFLVNHADISMGAMYLAQGWRLGEVEIRDQDFRVEIRGKAQRLQQDIVDLYSAHCRVDLGDSECGVDLADTAETFWRSGTVTSVVESRRIFVDTGLALGSGYEEVFRYGKLTWVASAGNNTGFSMEVKAFDSSTGTITLFQAMPYAIEIGDEFTVEFGCDKNVTTCKDRFDNVVNFRGEPFVPGIDRLLDIKPG